MGDKKTRESWWISDVGILGAKYLVMVIVNTALEHEATPTVLILIVSSGHQAEVARLNLKVGFLISWRWKFVD